MKEKIFKIFKCIGKILCVFFTIIGAISSIFGIYTFMTGKDYIPTKKLSLYEYHTVSLFNQKINNDELSVLYNNEKVESLYLVKYTVKNEGKEEIVPDDYIENLSITSNWGKIIESNITESSNEYIRKNVIEQTIIDKDIIIFPKLLLNPNDYYTITLIVTENPEKISYNSVISGVSKINHLREKNIIEESEKSRLRYNYISIIISSLTLIFLINLLYIFYISKKEIILFREKFNCSDTLSNLFATFYFRKLRKLKKEEKEQFDFRMKKTLEYFENKNKNI